MHTYASVALKNPINRNYQFIKNNNDISRYKIFFLKVFYPLTHHSVAYDNFQLLLEYRI